MNKDEESTKINTPAAIPADIKKAALAYCTNRKNFLKNYEGTLHHKYLDMLFLTSGTRPDLAEMVPLWVLGHSTTAGTHGYDGARVDLVPVECKTGSYKDCNAMRGFGSININDISPNTINKYDADNPEFLFSFFIEGHLIAIFEIHWAGLRPLCVDALDKPGRKCIHPSRAVWENFCTLRYKNRNKDLIELTPKRFQELIGLKTIMGDLG